MDAKWETLGRKHTLCPSSSCDTSFQGVVAKVEGIRYELVREFGLNKDTMVMLSSVRENQGSATMAHHEKVFNTFSRKLANTSHTYEEFKKLALDRITSSGSLL